MKTRQQAAEDSADKLYFPRSDKRPHFTKGFLAGCEYADGEKFTPFDEQPEKSNDYVHDWDDQMTVAAGIEPEAAEKGCKCQKCGRQYRVDIMIPDFLWEKVKPEGKSAGAGLLCGSCIADGLEQFGFNAFNLSEAASFEQPEKKDDMYVEDEGSRMLKEAFAKVRELARQPEAAGQEQEMVSIQWLKDERNILSNTASLMLPSEDRDRATHVAKCLDIAIQYIEESRKQPKP